MTRPTAHISVDLDTVDTHLAGYGIERPPCSRVYEVSVPRILETLERFAVRATFFVIARDAEAQARLLRRVVDCGHEVASHSVTHPLPFAALDGIRMSRELSESRRRLEDVTGEGVIGFRAPGWDVDRAALEAIAAAGYAYDASILPSAAMLPGTLLRCALGTSSVELRSFLRPLRFAFSQRLPHRLGGGLELWEFPVAVSPFLRIPMTHTLWYLAPAPLCRRILRRIGRRGGPLCYQFHAADLLDLESDGIDPRMSRHPGMRMPLPRKQALLDRALEHIAGSFATVPYADALLLAPSEPSLALRRPVPCA